MTLDKDCHDIEVERAQNLPIDFPGILFGKTCLIVRKHLPQVSTQRMKNRNNAWGKNDRLYFTGHTDHM